jgi:hypothetical protein
MFSEIRACPKTSVLSFCKLGTLAENMKDEINNLEHTISSLKNIVLQENHISNLPKCAILRNFQKKSGFSRPAGVLRAKKDLTIFVIRV